MSSNQEINVKNNLMLDTIIIRGKVIRLAIIDLSKLDLGNQIISFTNKKMACVLVKFKKNASNTRH